MEENNVNATAGAETKTKKSNKGLVIGIAVALVAVLVVVLVLTLGKGKKEITGDVFKEKLEALEWTVTDYTSLMSLASGSEETEGMTGMLMAQKDSSMAMFVTYEEADKASGYYKKSLEEFDEEITDQEGITVEKTKGKNFETMYIHGEVDGEEGYVKISRVGKTVLVLESPDKDTYQKVDKALGY